jgi:hypothetical protein
LYSKKYLLLISIRTQYIHSNVLSVWIYHIKYPFLTFLEEEKHFLNVK